MNLDAISCPGMVLFMGKGLSWRGHSRSAPRRPSRAGVLELISARLDHPRRPRKAENENPLRHKRFPSCRFVAVFGRNRAHFRTVRRFLTRRRKKPRVLSLQGIRALNIGGGGGNRTHE